MDWRDGTAAGGENVETDRYLTLFLDEASDLIQAFGDALLRYERGEERDGQLAELFRIAHSLKGMSATMGFHALADATHRMEDILGALRGQAVPASPEVIDLLFRSADVLEQTLAHVRATGREPDALPGDWLALLTQTSQRLAGAEGSACAVPSDKRDGAREVADDVPMCPDEAQGVVAAAQEAGMTVGWVKVTIDPACQLKGARAVLVHRAVSGVAEVLHCVPAAERMENGDYDDTLWFLVAAGEDDAAERLVTAASSVAEVSHAEFRAWANRQRESSSPGDTPSSSPTSDGVVPSTAGTSAQAVRDQWLRVSVDKVDALMQWCGELVIQRNRLATLLADTDDEDVRSVLDRVGHIAQALQETVNSLRMVRAEVLFRRFPRMVRDLSRQLQKPLELEWYGVETELDRTVIDDVFEALVHLIRNAADHGIEPLDQRRARGKPEAGRITLRAYSTGQHVRIEVQDDGGGIDVEAVRRRAVERGWLDPVAAARMSPEETYELLFQPGFSTAQVVSDVSGRGVGLDAVRERVMALGGRVDVQSEPGRGTLFRIHLPSNRTVLSVLLVHIRSQVYALPLTSVEEAVLAGVEDLQTVHGRHVYRFKDALVPIVDMGLWLYDAPSCQAYPWRLVICRVGDRQVALAVDRVLGQQEVANHPNAGYLAGIDWLAGLTTLGDGSVAFIVDPEACLQHARVPSGVRGGENG